jgi:hypothetical protein
MGAGGGVMVWGMSMPNNYGEFWPSGDYEKDPKTREGCWYDRLTAYYRKQTPEEQKRLFDYKGDPVNTAHFYGTFPAYKLKTEPGSFNNNRLEPAYGPLEQHEVPRSWDTRRTHKILGALVKLSSKILMVNAQLKDIIERLEPGVHEFHSCPIRMPKGQVYPGDYYIFRVGQYFDAFSREDSWEGSVEDFAGTKDYPPITHRLHLNETKKGVTGLAFKKSVFGSAHLWRDRIFAENLTCFSDTLIAEIEQAGLRIPKHYKMKEV